MNLISNNERKMRKDFLGNGGIFSSVYRKYGTLKNHVKVNATSGNPENIFNWMDFSVGFHSEISDTITYETLQIDFKEPFYFESFRTMIFKNWRFNNNFIVEASYRNSGYSLVHENVDELCSVVVINDCNNQTEKSVFIEREKVRLCDSIRFIAIDKDSYSTYSLVFSKLEVYGFYPSSSRYCSYRKANTLMYALYLILISK